MSKMTPMIKNFVMAALLVVIGALVGYRVRDRVGNLQQISSQPKALFRVINTDQPAGYQDIDFHQFWDVWKTLENNYVDPSKIQKDQMVYGAIKGMTASLGDPYTVFLPPTDQKRTTEDLQGSFYGVGIELGYTDNILSVVAPIKDSPADKAGVKPKDLIIHVRDDGKSLNQDTTGWSLSEAVDYIRGDKGTNVILTLVRRDGQHTQPFDVTLQRSEIIVPSAQNTYVKTDNGKKIAHITLSRFGERTHDELNTIIEDINAQNPPVDGIILDMRNNPGGFLDGAIDVASEFIPDGVVVTQKGRSDSHDFLSKGTARLAKYPVVVVVNGGSASAAEIVAGALRDRRSAKLIGEKTFGKGTVQDAMQLSNGAGLHVTVARWLLPKGDWINATGIPVTTEVKNDPSKPDQDLVLQRAETELFQ